MFVHDSRREIQVIQTWIQARIVFCAPWHTTRKRPLASLGTFRRKVGKPYRQRECNRSAISRVQDRRPGRELFGNMSCRKSTIAWSTTSHLGCTWLPCRQHEESLSCFRPCTWSSRLPLLNDPCRHAQTCAHL